MTDPRLLPEIWGLVLFHLRQPLPAPTGRNERVSIRQPDLAACMRVNRLFYDLTSPLLYNTIISDHLPSLVSHLHTPAAAPDLKSKTQLLSSCKHLYLEYCHKDEPTYPTLLKHGGSFYLLVGSSQSISDRSAFGKAETVWLGEAAESLNGLMRQLRTHSSGAMLGGQTEWWKPVWEDWRETDPDMEQQVNQMRDRVSQLFSRCAGAGARPRTVAVMCQRVEYGPLTYAPLLWPCRALGSRTHIDAVPCGEIPPVIGGLARWHGEYTGVTEGPVTTKAVEQLVHIIGRHVRYRLQMSDYRGAVDSKFEVDIYIPPAFLRPSVANYFYENLERSLGDVVRGPGQSTPVVKGDSWRLKPLAEAPPCEACGWCADDL